MLITPSAWVHKSRSLFNFDSLINWKTLMFGTYQFAETILFEAKRKIALILKDY